MRSFLAGAVTTLSLAVLLAPESVVAKTSLPEIRSSAANFVPRCATPHRLMTFLKSRNPDLDPRYRDIADWYRHWGEVWRVRWDYAFFQMALETNFLAFRRADGTPGDVRPAQNNFAGLGTTGGGVPGDSYADVSTGVLAQIQHLVAYSGERLAAPVGPRTRLKQDDIVAASLGLGRPVRFADLARRWATDPKYGRSLEWVAERYREAYCPDPAGRAAAASGADARSGLGGEPKLVRPPRPVTARDAAGGWRTDTTPTAPRRTGTGGRDAAVRTVWSSTRPGDVPLLPQTGPAPAPRRLAAVAAGSASAPATAVAHPVTAVEASTSIPPLVASARMTETASAADPSGVAGGEETPAIRLSAAASPFAAGHVIAQSAGPHGACRIIMASYGGLRAVLIRSTSSSAVDLVVLSVIPGFEDSMASNFIRTRLPGGDVEAIYADRDAALVRARTICPEAS